MERTKWRRAHVLAVDDYPANLVTIDAVLSQDCDVIRASSGEQALAILQARDDIDVILMDVQMPGMDGFATAAKIKQLPGCRDIPIVFITAVYREDPFVKQGYEAGAVDYFSKPFDPEILRAKVSIYSAFRQKSDLLKEWERRLRESEELLRAGRQFSAVLERLRMGVIVTDVEGRILNANPEAIDLGVPDWWDGDGRLLGGRAPSIAHVLAKGETAHETRELPGADGAPRSLLCTASPLQTPGGAVVGVVLIVRDVTERNRLELDMEQRIQHLTGTGSRASAQ